MTPASFKLAVEKVARINGDSDSMACQTGMFLGAAGGLEALPEDWLEGLFRRQEIEAMARNLQGARWKS